MSHSRWPSTILLGLIAILASLTLNGYPLKIITIFCLVLTLFELVIAVYDLPEGDTRAVEVQVLLTLAALSAITLMPPRYVILIVASAWLTDTCAYITGKLYGRLIWRRRPFPTLSPRKTWEGLLGAFLFTPIAILMVYLIALGEYPSHFSLFDAWFIGTASIFATLGDLIGSYTKRTIGVKDSCEMVTGYRIFEFLEQPMGGRHGQGGYLDRFDSVSLLAVVTFCVLIISSLLGFTA